MRCNECGYMNEQEAGVCVKCGTKLTAGQQADSGFNDVKSVGGSPTVKGKIASQPAWDAQPGTPGNSGYHRCPDCGHYPLQQPASGGYPCPNCSTTGSARPAAVPPSGSGNEGISQPGSNHGKTARLEDVNFGSKPAIVFTDIQTGDRHEFTGNRVELNRDNLDPDNDAISSHHAQLSFKNGKWFITDISSNQATFIQVQGETPLPDDCKIIIGNKIFKVELP